MPDKGDSTTKERLSQQLETLKEGATAAAAGGETGSEAKATRTKGLTADEFDGVGIGTLRAWVRFWNDEGRSAKELEAINAKSGHEGFSRDDHVRVIEDEIAARLAAREAEKAPATGEVAS